MFDWILVPIYDIIFIGHEFRAVFLSTCEPLELDGRSKDPLKSLCNPYVFNTAISRAKSLVVAVGNPFMLLKIENIMGSRRHCWKEYLKMCLKQGTVFFSRKYNAFLRKKVIDDLHDAVEIEAQESISFLTKPQPLPPHHFDVGQTQKLLEESKTPKNSTINKEKMSYAQAVKATPKGLLFIKYNIQCTIYNIHLTFVEPLKHQVKTSVLSHEKKLDEVLLLVSSSDSDADSDQEERRAEYLKDIGFL